MRRMLPLACVLLATAMAAELPVRNVVLYKHGVGYFERSGDLGPGEAARLDFKASEMNDVLKSLTLSTSGGDKVTSLRYDASEPVQIKLAKFPMRLDAQQPISHLLDQLKGATLELSFGSDTLSGAILGARLQPSTQEQREREQVTLLLDTGELRTLDLSAASSIRFPDAKLQSQLKDYLSVLTGARSVDSRSVYIDSTDSGRRSIAISYMIPTPVWKSSYRLILKEKAKPILEGWAIVDNTTGEDWSQVRLALVSGRPISFISQLYEPKYVTRPTAELPEERAQAPVVHKGAVLEAPVVEMEASAPSREGMRRMAMGGGGGGVPPAPPPAPKMMPGRARQDILSNVASTAQGRELGELFEYSFEAPVSVRKNESAMLPFLQQELLARKLLIYSDESLQHPMNAAEITNSTGKTLDGGPITVFDSSAYAGEALMETLKAGDKRLISYGIDLGTRITTKFDSDSARVQEIHYRRGILTATSTIRETKTFTIRNVDEKPKKLILEHAVRPSYKLLEGTPSEKTDNGYRFEVELSAGATEQFPITEETTLSRNYSISNQTPDLLASFVQNKELSAESREKLERILAIKSQIAEADNQIARIETEIQELINDQNRIRENISSLNRVSGQQEQVQKYAAELAGQESQLAGLRDSLSELRGKRAELQTELDQQIQTMSF